MAVRNIISAAAMAASTSRRCGVNPAGGVVVYVLALAAAATTASAVGARGAGDASCRIADTAVFPYWSYCSRPARYGFANEAYYIRAAQSSRGLAQQWDDVSSVGLSYYPSTYTIVSYDPKYRPYVKLSDDVRFMNTETGGVLAWRVVDNEKKILVETTDIFGSEASPFQFTIDEEIPLPCPRIYPPPQCHAYTISDFNSTSGLAPHYEDGVTYFEQSYTNNFPFVLVRAPFASLSKNTTSSVV